jgi:hypothetical protein
VIHSVSCAYKHWAGSGGYGRYYMAEVRQRLYGRDMAEAIDKIGAIVRSLK